MTWLSTLFQPAGGLFAQASFSTNIEDVTTIVQSAGKRTGMDLKDDITLFGSLILVAGLLFFLTAVFRKRGHRHRDRRDYAPPPPSRPSEEVTADGKIRRRKRRRDHRPRNPTRAEAGGLPPRREGDEDMPPV